MKREAPRPEVIVLRGSRARFAGQAPRLVQVPPSPDKKKEAFGATIEERAPKFHIDK